MQFTVGSPPGKVFESETRDISGTGLSFETEAPLQVMDELRVSFQVSKKKKLDSFATVVTSENVEKYTNLIGVEFHGLLPEVQKQLMEFLHEISPEETQEK